MSTTARYRIVANCAGTVTFEFSDEIADALAIRDAIGGTIQIYVFGIGWVLWSPLLEGE